MALVPGQEKQKNLPPAEKKDGIHSLAECFFSVQFSVETYR
jgi:hypothetical protein